MKPVWIYALLVIGNIFLLAGGCKKRNAVNLPTLSKVSVSDITKTTATGSCNVISDGGSSVTERGICWSTDPAPSITGNKTSDGTGTGSYSGHMTDLSPNTTYYVRAYASNSAGTDYGDTISFSTVPVQLPVLTTSIVSDISETTATCGGNISSDGGSAVSERGVCWSTRAMPTVEDNKTSDGTGTGDFASQITGLIPGTKYYVRAFAVNGLNFGYGNTDSFSTVAAQATVTDIDGNVYSTITIGPQVWMKENLKVTHYRNGDPIGVTDSVNWQHLITGAYCINNLAGGYDPVYGNLYNWYAVNDARNIAPEGWHVATLDDNLVLINSLGSDINLEGGKMKEAGFDHWQSPNLDADNSSGFTALPGGLRDYYGHYMPVGTIGYYWLNTVYSDQTLTAFTMELSYSTTRLGGNFASMVDGLSVRCVKD